MMSGPKRNPDALNTIGVVVVGICGAVLVYVSIVALQAFYLNDTSEVQTMADYGGNDVTARSIKTSQINNLTEYGSNPAAEGKAPTFRVPIDEAMKQVVQAAKVDPANLVPTQGRSDRPTVKPIFGRPQPTQAPAAAPVGDRPDAVTPPGGGAGSAIAPGAGSATSAPGSATTPAAGGVGTPGTQMTPTAGQGGGGAPGPATGAGTKGDATPK
jgi:hypothetical protein